MATTMSCIIITTLIVVSLANLVLLVHVIMHTMGKCDRTRSPTKKIQRIQKRDDNTLAADYKISLNKHKFMAALILLNDENEIDFVCGVAIISKNWILASAHCAESILDQPIDQVKIFSNASKLEHGIWHDLDKIMIHENYNSFRRNNDVSLMSVKQPFKGKNVASIALPSMNFKYLANTTATTLGWIGIELYAIDVKLLWYKHCDSFYPDDNIPENAMFCAGRSDNQKETCVLDYGGILVQKNLLIGMISFGIGCGLHTKPTVYTKTAMFEEWVRSVEKRDKVGATFKSKN